MRNEIPNYDGYSPEWFDAQYNIRALRPDFEETVVKKWTLASETARATLPCQLSLRYGSGNRQTMDVFTCGTSAAPTLIYLHGGYWFSGDKSSYSFLAKGFADVGLNLVVPNYDLCPNVSITELVAQVREAIAFVWKNAETLGLNADKLSVMGHSAGGHLTQMMLGTNWPELSPELPANLVKSGIPTSPLSLLEPVRRTEVLNANIQMDRAEAEAQSPLLQHPPLTNAPITVAVGGTETPEFIRQATIYAEEFSTPSRKIDLLIVPGADHFDIVTTLGEPESALFQKVISMAHMG